MRDRHWVLYAACRGRQPEWWTLDPGSLTPANRAALDICAGCPVRQPCLADAARRRDWGVIRGGIPLRQDGRDRRRLLTAAGALP